MSSPMQIMVFISYFEREEIANLIGHGDVRCYTVEQVRKFCESAGLTVERIEKKKKFRLHLVAGK